MHMINNVFSQSYHIRVSHMWCVCVREKEKQKNCVCELMRFTGLMGFGAGKKMNKCIMCKQLFVALQG